MLKHIVEVRPLDGYRLYLCFEDGVEGVIDLAELIPFEGVFAPLKECAKFQEVRLNRELGAIYWPNGADLDPYVLYSEITGAPLPSSTPAATG